MQKGVGRPLHVWEKYAHSNLNRLRLHLVNKKTRSVAKQVLRKLQGGLAPVANEGVDVVTCDQAKHWEKWKTCSCPMASELLEGIICSCTTRIRCTNNCSCSQNSLCSTELCTCHGNENCENPHSVSDLDILHDDDEDDSVLYAGWMFLVAAPNRLTNIQSFVMNKLFAKKRKPKRSLYSHIMVLRWVHCNCIMIMVWCNFKYWQIDDDIVWLSLHVYLCV